jgi:hypothetical protein
VPRVAEFYGIAVYFFYNDHEPAHFHVRYESQRALVSIRPLRVLRGTLPGRAWTLVREWAAPHEQELQANWQRARACEPLQPIAPLE